MLALAWAGLLVIDLNPIFRGMSFGSGGPFPAGSYPFGFVIGAGRLGRLLAIRLFLYALAIGTITSTTIALACFVVARATLLRKPLGEMERNRLRTKMDVSCHVTNYEWYSAAVCAFVTAFGVAEWRFLLPLPLLPWALAIGFIGLAVQIFGLGGAAARERSARRVAGLLIAGDLATAWWAFGFAFWLANRGVAWPL